MSETTKPLEELVAGAVAEAQNVPFVGAKQRKIAQAVLAALTGAGGVEWGVRWDYISEMYPERTDRKESQEAAQASLDRSFGTGSVVSRVTGPWTGVAG